MSAGGLVDWRLAERVATAAAGRGGSGPAAVTPRVLREACSEALAGVIAYTGLEPAGATPEPELVGREEWARSALASLAPAVAPLERRALAGLTLRGPLGGAARAVLGAAAGAEAGVAVGYAARRVVGQYDVALFGEPRPARLLFVAPNLNAAGARLGADPGLFLRWVALHESTHVLQFEAVPWLTDHLRGLAHELLEGTAAELDLRKLLSELGRAVRRDPREVVRAALRGELVRALAAPKQRRLLDRLQATMTVVEGHAEHVMDAAAGDDPELRRLRQRLDARRAARGGLGSVIARLLGLDLKLRQYEQGKRFFDAVAERGGAGAVGLVWSRPAALPSLAEIEAPERWLARVTDSSPLAA